MGQNGLSESRFLKGALRVRASLLRTWLLTLMSVLGLVLMTGSMAQAAPQTGRILSVKIGGEGKATRVVVESDSALTYHVFMLSAGSYRVVLDLPRVRWSLNGLTSEAGSGKGSGAVSGYRYAHNTATTSRLVLDLNGPAIVARDFALAPKTKSEKHRIVLDLEPATAAAFAREAEGDMAGPKPVTQQTSRKPLIVVDAGHGGKDPGSMSKGGLKEKDLTLTAALALRDELLKTDRYDVALTRSTDVFIELEDRPTKARNLGADLFISLHADAGPKPETRGASVYTLSPEGEKRIDGARRQNDWILDVEVDSGRPEMVNQILADLVQRETKNQSARFGEILATKTGEAGWPMLQNTHRKKSLYVLLSPDVPAVLLEMGFINNPEDERQLTDSASRRRLMDAVGDAVDAWFARQVKTASR